MLADTLLQQFVVAITSPTLPEVSIKNTDNDNNDNNHQKKKRSRKELKKDEESLLAKETKELDEKIVNRYIRSISELQRIGFIRLTSTGHQIRKLMVTWVT